jgi:large subunit ribosomal protein L31
MKPGIHPNYQLVVIADTASDFATLTRSTKTSDKTYLWTDGKEYPLIEVETSSGSHPFFTGHQKIVDTAGRIQRFQRKYANNEKKT